MRYHLKFEETGVWRALGGRLEGVICETGFCECCPRPVIMIIPRLVAPKVGYYSRLSIKVFFIILKFLSLERFIPPTDWFLFSGCLILGTKPLISKLLILSLMRFISS